MTFDEIFRSLLIAANVFVSVYAFTSAGRMEYRGSRWGRITLGMYSVVLVATQASLVSVPVTRITLLSSIATVAGICWFTAEVLIAARTGSTGAKRCSHHTR